jgi:glutamine cyclotransferase
MKLRYLWLFAALWTQACWSRVQESLVVEVHQEYRHDPEAFTQGLTVYEGQILEGTGLVGKSSLRWVNLESGIPSKIMPLADSVFGEGVAIWRDRIFQLSWQNQRVFVYDLHSWELVNTFKWPKEGWGLTSTGEELILSDGSDQLYFIDPLNFRVKRQVTVRNQNRNIDKINELEYVNGKVLANIWQTGMIAVIDPENGKVLEMWDATQLVQKIPELERTGMDVLNGIAWDQENQKLYLTGKKWARLFEVRVPGSVVFENP